MQFASAGLGSVSLGSILQDPGTITDPTASRPILTEHNDVDVRAFIRMDTLRIIDTLGQPVTASFTMMTPSFVPVVGERIRILYFSHVLFSGTIDHVTKATPDLLTLLYDVDCLDRSQTLLRRKINRIFLNRTSLDIVVSVLSNEIAGEGLSIGTIEGSVRMPLVEGKNARVFDVLRDVAGATGQTFYVDFDQSIQMRSTSVPVAPLTLNEANVLLDGVAVQTDLETYRNRQTVIVKGTAAAGVEPVIVTRTEDNQDQIDERQAIEGGTGIYEEIEEVTHPTSNNASELALLAIGYTRLRLATSGTPRVIVRCQVRGYGFRAGQVATVDLPTFGLSGTFMVQRVSIREQDGQWLFHDLELTSSSSQQRAYESWLAIVRTGKVTVQLPDSIGINLATFTTPGADTWTVPAGVTIAVFTCKGAGGGGGGGVRSWYRDAILFLCVNLFYDGGDGGNGGKAVTTQSVIEGQVWDVVVGAAGVAGTNGTENYASPSCASAVAKVAGGSGGLSKISLSGVISCKGNGGGGGGTPPAPKIPGTTGNPGSGTGDTVIVGGGKPGGIKGYTSVQPSNGGVGKVEVRW